MMAIGLALSWYVTREEEKEKKKTEVLNEKETKKDEEARDGHALLEIGLLVGTGLAGLLWLLQQGKEKKPESTSTASDAKRPNHFAKNHDHEKRKYRSREDADKVIDKMRRRGKDPKDTLNSYYNTKYSSWFIGNSSR